MRKKHERSRLNMQCHAASALITCVSDYDTDITSHQDIGQVPGSVADFKLILKGYFLHELRSKKYTTSG